MKNINAMSSRIDGASLKVWLIGTACGVFLTVSLALGTGRLELRSPHAAQPAVIVQQAPVVAADGLVPPPLDEFAQYQQQLAALRTSIGLVPPPVDEIAQYRRAEAAARAAAETAPPSIDEVQQYHQRLANMLDHAAPPMPVNLETRY